MHIGATEEENGTEQANTPPSHYFKPCHRIPNEAYAADYVAVGKVLKVCVEFSLVEPQGGLHFVVPENPFKHQGCIIGA